VIPDHDVGGSFQLQKKLSYVSANYGKSQCVKIPEELGEAH